VASKKDKNKGGIQDILLKRHRDRRLLSNVPDAMGMRTKGDRRGNESVPNTKDRSHNKAIPAHSGVRYIARVPVMVTCWFKKGVPQIFYCMSENISTTGILLVALEEKHKDLLASAIKIRLKFKLEPGVMPEGYESKFKLYAIFVRETQTEDGAFECGMQFSSSLNQYIYKHRAANLRALSLILLFMLAAVVVLMRTESVIYFRFNRVIYFYSILTAIFLLSRYFFGALYKPVPVDENFTPGVSIIIPCFNEETWIQQTILGCVDQDYPLDKLEVIVVDDCSTDNSFEKIQEMVDVLFEQDGHYLTKGRVQCFKMPENGGKREALSRGVMMAKHELVVFVDSDSFLEPDAIKNLVQPFKDPKMGGVTGRTDVANTYTNVLTKMQSVRYYIAFRIMKAAEAYFDAVTCLSGPISCYRKELVMEHMDKWLNQRFMGKKATFGDDRAMTNFILKTHRTGYQDTAVCSTIVPNAHKQFLKQQMRWKRSWLRESSYACSFIWRKEPLMVLFFYAGFIIPLLAPVVVIYNLLYVPIFQGVFPWTFLVGLFVMAMLMSMAQLFFRRSSTWVYGFVFCFYYEAVLLWQMPVAWVTFYRSTWGTRMTPHDVKAAQKKHNGKAMTTHGANFEA